MLRFIVKRTLKDPDIGISVLHITVDAEVPELERLLTGGGYSEDACDARELAGAEVIKTIGLVDEWTNGGG